MPHMVDYMIGCHGNTHTPAHLGIGSRNWPNLGFPGVDHNTNNIFLRSAIIMAASKLNRVSIIEIISPGQPDHTRSNRDSKMRSPSVRKSPPFKPPHIMESTQNFSELFCYMQGWDRSLVLQILMSHIKAKYSREIITSWALQEAKGY